jgi:hypothetical protein
MATLITCMFSFLRIFRSEFTKHHKEYRRLLGQEFNLILSKLNAELLTFRFI